MTDLELSRILREVVERIRKQYPDVNVTGSVSQHCLKYERAKHALGEYYVMHVVIQAEANRLDAR